MTITFSDNIGRDYVVLIEHGFIPSPSCSIHVRYYCTRWANNRKLEIPFAREAGAFGSVARPGPMALIAEIMHSCRTKCSVKSERFTQTFAAFVSLVFTPENQVLIRWINIEWYRSFFTASHQQRENNHNRLLHSPPLIACVCTSN